MLGDGYVGSDARKPVDLGAVLVADGRPHCGAAFAFAVSFDEVVTALLLGAPHQRTIPRKMSSDPPTSGRLIGG